jgi:hypothetical protein
MAMEPTVGRVVHFYPNGDDRYKYSGPGPLVALIAKVTDNGRDGHHVVTLAAFSDCGIPFAVQETELHNPDADVEEGVSYAAWMPYQVQKATGGDHNSESAEPRPS